MEGEKRGVVKVEKLDRALGAEDVRRIFGEFGEIRRVHIDKGRNCFIEFGSRTAGEAARRKDGNTLCDIGGRNRRTRKGSREFVWNVSLMKRGFLWEDLFAEKREEQRIMMEKAIVEEKRKNMRYVEAIQKRSEGKL